MASGCQWIATSSAGWLSLAVLSASGNGMPAFGNGFATFTAAPNLEPTARSAVASVAGISVVLTHQWGAQPGSSSLAVPTLLAPGPRALIPQRYPDPDCWVDPSFGGGYSGEVAFDWTDVPSAVAYRILVTGPAATLPLLDGRVEGSSLVFKFCGGGVIDSNRLGWTWRVASLAVDGRQGPWSAEGTYDLGSR